VLTDALTQKNIFNGNMKKVALRPSKQIKNFTGSCDITEHACMRVYVWYCDLSAGQSAAVFSRGLWPPHKARTKSGKSSNISASLSQFPLSPRQLKSSSQRRAHALAKRTKRSLSLYSTEAALGCPLGRVMVQLIE